MKTFIGFMISASVFGAGGDYDYDLNGANWDGECAVGFRQSPIDLTGEVAYSYDLFANVFGY
jgi:hypothetical protein